MNTNIAIMELKLVTCQQEYNLISIKLTYEVEKLKKDKIIGCLPGLKLDNKEFTVGFGWIFI